METILSNLEPPRSSYNYRELRQNQLRLLTTKCIDGAVEIEIEQYTFTEDLDYDAVSYVWGSSLAWTTIKCSGNLLVVTSTALEMLYYLHQYQTNTTARKIWIDAICINQEDEEEKSIQIPLMRDIYSGATAVVVWMGLSTPETEVFFGEFQEVMTKQQTWMVKFSADRGCSDPEKEELPCHGEAFWKGLSRLLNNEWFRRLWTFQEILLPSTATLLCGTLSVDFDEFVDFLMDGFYNSSFFARTSKLASSTNDVVAARICYAITFYRKSTARNRGFLEMKAFDLGIELCNLRGRRVKEPVDRVWAIAGLVQKGFRDKLTSCIDYSAQGREEYWKTWIMFARALMDEPGGIDLLHSTPTLERKSPHLPSWCPNLSGKSACRVTIDGRWNDPIVELSSSSRWALFEENSYEQAPKRREAIWNHVKTSVSTLLHEDVLCVRGFVVDSIEEIVEHKGSLDMNHGHYDPGSAVEMALYDVAVDCHLRGLDLARRVFYGKSEDVTDIPEDFITSVFLDCRITQAAKKVYHEVLPRLATWYSYPSGWFYAGPCWEHIQCHFWLAYMRGHTFFSTKGGRIGYAYPGIQSGDQIAALYGGEALYVLRDLDTTSDGNGATGEASAHSQFVSAAFIPHLMEQHQRDSAHIRPDTMFLIH